MVLHPLVEFLISKCLYYNIVSRAQNLLCIYTGVFLTKETDFLVCVCGGGG